MNDNSAVSGDFRHILDDQQSFADDEQLPVQLNSSESLSDTSLKKCRQFANLTKPFFG